MELDTEFIRPPLLFDTTRPTQEIGQFAEEEWMGPHHRVRRQFVAPA